MPNPRSRANTEWVAAMLGDVNLFLNDPDSRCHGELEVLHSLKAPAASCQSGMRPHTALLQVMICSPSRRRQGFAKEAVSLFIAWLCQSLVMSQFLSKYCCSLVQALPPAELQQGRLCRCRCALLQASQRRGTDNTLPAGHATLDGEDRHIQCWLPGAVQATGLCRDIAQCRLRRGHHGVPGSFPSGAGACAAAHTPLQT